MSSKYIGPSLLNALINPKWKWEKYIENKSKIFQEPHKFGPNLLAAKRKIKNLDNLKDNVPIKTIGVSLNMKDGNSILLKKNFNKTIPQTH